MTVRQIDPPRTGNGAGQQPALPPGEHREPPALPAPTTAPPYSPPHARAHWGWQILAILVVLVILGGAAAILSITL